MIKKQILTFILRWITSCLAMYACINVFATFAPEAEAQRNAVWFYVFAGLIFALANSIVKPILTIFALPFLLITLGLFTVIVNTAIVALTIWIIPGVTIDFWSALGGSLMISLINYLVGVIGLDKLKE